VYDPSNFVESNYWS